MMYTNTLFAVIFGLVCGIWVASELLGPVRWSRMRAGEKRDRSSALAIVVAGGLVGMGLCFLFPLILPEARLPWQLEAFWGGLAVTLAGIGWRWYAIVTLGSYFTAALMIHPNQSVVQHGPYRWVRHPSYSGILLTMIGLGLMLGNWVSLLVLTAGLGILISYRIQKEEQELLQHLGQPYRDYMQRTRRLIPFIF